MVLRTIFSETIKKKSLGRTLLNLYCQGIAISGTGMDLGSKSGNASYYRFLRITPGTQITYTDLYHSGPNILRLDLEAQFPVPNESHDFLLLMNVLEHLYAYENCLTECLRILRPKGRLIGAVPFLHKIHPDPDDHWRYTGSTLIKLLSAIGFSTVQVTPLGFGPFSAALSICSPLPRLRLLVALASVLAISCDRALFPKDKGTFYYPLAYAFVASK